MIIRTKLSAATALATLLLSPAPARATPPENVSAPFEGIGDHVLASLTGTNLLWFGSAAAITFGMSASGGDHRARVFIDQHFASHAWSTSATYTGYLLPVVVAPAIWISGAIAKDPETAGAGAAAIQALATSFAMTTFLEVATGRPYPINDGDPNASDRLEHPEYAKAWKPFSFHNRFAWPSGHTAATTSIVAALTAYYYPDRIWIPLVGYPIAFAIGAGMLSGERHWTSDVLSGAIIAHAIGWSIGRSFRMWRSGNRAHLVVVPIAGGGLALAGDF